MSKSALTIMAVTGKALVRVAKLASTGSCSFIVAIPVAIAQFALGAKK